MAEPEFEGWAILELKGHRRLGGYVREVTMFGGAMCRIDIPRTDGDGNVATQYYDRSSIYGLTPTTEEAAKVVARGLRAAAPVQHWELPARTEPDDDDGDPY